MKNLVVHYKNKFPGAIAEFSDDRLDVYRGDEHLIALRKNGAGQLVDMSEELGCSERHDLSPIPKDARVYKEVNGKIAMDDKAEERRKLRSKFIKGGKVLSCEVLSKQGFEFDDKQRVVSAPALEADKK